MEIILVTILAVAIIAMLAIRRVYQIRERMASTSCRKLLQDALWAVNNNELEHGFAEDGSELIFDAKLPDAIRLTTHNKDGELQITLYDIAEITEEVIERSNIIPCDTPAHVVHVLRELDIMVDNKFVKSLKYNNAPQCALFYRTGKGSWSILTNVLMPEAMAEQEVDVLPPAKGELERSASPNFTVRRYFSTIGRFVVTTVHDQRKYQPIPEVVLGIWAFVWLASSDEALRRRNLKLTLRNLDGIICIDVQGAKRDEVRRCAEIINGILDELTRLEIMNSAKIS